MIDYSWISENFPDSDFLIDNPTHLLLCDMQSNSSFIPKICLWSTYFYFKKSTIPGWIVQIYLCSIWSVSQSGNPTLHEHISYIINSSMGFCYTYKWQIDLINLLFHILNCDKRIQKYRQSLICWIGVPSQSTVLHPSRSVFWLIHRQKTVKTLIFERDGHTLTPSRWQEDWHWPLSYCTSTWVTLHTLHCKYCTLHTAHQAGHNAHLAATLHTTHYYCH